MGRIFKLIKSLFKNIFVLRKKNIRVSPLAYFDDKCIFEKNIYVDRFCILHDAKIGQFSYIGYGTSIQNAIIGRYCSIGPDIKIGPGKHPTNFVSTSPIFYSENNPLGIKLVKGTYYEESDIVIIGNDVWIGANAVIMGGLEIGDGAIIAAGSIVTKNVEPYAIVGGIPAKVIKYRFAPEEIKELIRIQWWKWDIEKIETKVDSFRNLGRFLQ